MQNKDLMAIINFIVDETYAVDSSDKIPVLLTAMFNACSDDLTEVTRLQKTATIPFTPGQTTLTLPADCYRPIKEFPLWFGGQPVDRLLLQDTGAGFKFWGNTITLMTPPITAGNYTLYYYGKLPRLTGVSTEEPPIMSEFHELYTLYFAAKYMHNLMDERDNKRDFIEEYTAKKAELAMVTLANDEAPYVKTPDRLPLNTHVFREV